MTRLWMGLVMSVALLSAGASQARPYLVAVYSPSALQFVELSSIVHLPRSHRTAQLTSVAAKGGTLDGQHAVVQRLSLEVDCIQSRLRVIEAQSYDGQLHPLFTATERQSSDWRTPKVGSAGQATLQIICRVDSSTKPTLDLDGLDALVERVQRALESSAP